MAWLPLMLTLFLLSSSAVLPTTVLEPLVSLATHGRGLVETDSLKVGHIFCFLENVFN